MIVLKYINNYYIHFKYKYKMILSVIKHTKTTQILYGIIGSMYGMATIIEYYPKLIYNEFIKEYNLDLENLKENELESIKKYIKPFIVKKPLFIIEDKSMTFSIAMSSIFYGSLFACAGIIPFITFPLISTYGIYYYNINKENEKNNVKNDINDKNEKK